MESIINVNNIEILKQILENSYNSVVITDANLEDETGPKFLYVNPAFTKMTGYTFDEVKDKTPRILQGEKTQREVLDELKEKCKKGEFFSGTTVNYKKDGTAYNVEWNISPLKDPQGNIVKYISIQKDITKDVLYKTALEEKVQEQLEQLRQKDKILLNQSKLAAMGEMVDAIAHQWKQPIGIIKLNVEMMQYDFEEGLVDDAYMKEFQDKVFQQLNHTINTLQTFRSFLKPNTQPKKFTISSVLNKVTLLLKDEFMKHQIHIDKYIEDNFELNGFENEFQHFILNILNNAKDAYGDKKEEQKRVIEIKSYLHDEQKVLEICDYAGGIPEEILPHIFKAHVTTKDESKGSGIGLYMTEQIVAKHNGILKAFNHENSGAVFKASFV